MLAYFNLFQMIALDMFFFAKILYWTWVWDDFFLQILKICHKNAEKFCKTDKKEASQRAKKHKKVFVWIFIKDMIFVIADTAASFRKEHIHKLWWSHTTFAQTLRF